MKTKVRTRLTPEARRLQLLQTAKIMIIEAGLQNFTMEALARTAAVSSPLVYNYFASRQALLGELLTLEYATYTSNITQAVRQAKNFNDVVRIVITSNFDHYAPGSILPILTSQPEIVSAIASTRKKNSRQIAKFLVDNTAQSYQLDKRRAEFVVTMSSGASIAAAEFSTQRGFDREQAIEMTLAYVLAGLERISTWQS